MSVTIWYDTQAGCYTSHEPTRDVYSAGVTWQRAIEAIVEAVKMWDRVMAMSPEERRTQYKERR